MRQINDKREPVAEFRRVEVTFSTPNSDVVVLHDLLPPYPYEVRFMVVDASAPGVVSRGLKPAAAGYIVLRASVAGTYRIMLFTEAHAGLTKPIPLPFV